MRPMRWDVILKTTDPYHASRHDQAASLLTAHAVRSAADRMLGLALDQQLTDWDVDLGRLDATAEFVARVVRDRFVHLNPPVHARWRHFVFDGRDLWRELIAARHAADPAAVARSAIDLAVMSVLLDAGASPQWRYRDAATGWVAGRSEGLALASFRWFESGALSVERLDPLRVDAQALLAVDTESLETAFQASAAEPLLGAAGRAALLNRLGAALQARTDLFAAAGLPRPGGLYDFFKAHACDGTLPASFILETLLDGLGSIWPERLSLHGTALGDCWRHPAFIGDSATARYVPLHKLSQWLTYSLIEPLQWGGITVSAIDELTGLAEYRNGGLFVDMGVVVPKDLEAPLRTHAVSDPFIVGWRSLTVALLDRLAPLVRARLHVSANVFPLACLLEGGTWVAGRLLARERRVDGGPPFLITSDGTVF